MLPDDRHQQRMKIREKIREEATMTRPVRIRAVTPLDGFLVHLEFTDGTAKDVDLEKYLPGPIFEPLRNEPARFREMMVDSRAGTIVWPNGADIDPDVLYEDLTSAWMEPDEQPAADSIT